MLADSVARKETVTDRSAQRGFDPDRIAGARRKLDAMGISIKQWAERNGHSYSLVRKVLANTKACTRGESHRIAVKLGLKDGTI